MLVVDLPGLLITIFLVCKI